MFQHGVYECLGNTNELIFIDFLGYPMLRHDQPFRRLRSGGGMGWDGMGWDGMGWDGMGWDGMEWDGMGWDGMRS